MVAQETQRKFKHGDSHPSGDGRRFLRYRKGTGACTWLRPEAWARYCEKKKEHGRTYYEGHRAERAEYKKAHREANIEVYRERAASSRKKNPQRHKTWQKQYYAKHREEILRKCVSRNNARRKTDPAFRLLSTLRARLWNEVSGRKSTRTEELVGCTAERLKAHIESRFKPGMTWGNHGVNGWHVDHIIPCASFDLTDPVQQKHCFHYTNLQPLWAAENRSKGARIFGWKS